MDGRKRGRDGEIGNDVGEVGPTEAQHRYNQGRPLPSTTKGRKGKGVTTLQGFLECDETLKIIAKKLKQRCSTGGTVKDGIVELQGDHRDAVKGELEDMGYVIKFSGG